MVNGVVRGFSVFWLNEEESGVGGGGGGVRALGLICILSETHEKERWQ